jgi:hypothetical protein
MKTPSKKNKGRSKKGHEKEDFELKGEREYIDMGSSASEPAPEIADRANLLYDETAGEAFAGDVMGEQSDVNPVSDINNFEDPMEADIDQRLKLGFALEKPEEGVLGEEGEYIGDLPEQSLRRGNRYDPSLSAGTSAYSGLEIPDDLDMHVTRESNIGMAYGPDKYTEDAPDDEGGSRRNQVDDDEEENQSIH